MSKRDPARAATKAMLREFSNRRLVVPARVRLPEYADDDDDGIAQAGSLAAMLDDPLDPRSAVSPARARRWLEQQAQDRDAEQVWTVNEVKWRLEEAARIGERVVRRDGPSQDLGFWPALGRPTFAEQVAMIETGELERLRRQINDEGGGGASEIQVSRFEQAIMWPIHYLGPDRFERERMVLQSWIKALAFREPWRRWMIEPEPTSHRVRWQALVLITCGLIRDKARMV
jgi:hypothetical protein